MKYGDLPVQLGEFKVNCNEMLFYQYLPIKLRKKKIDPVYESRLFCFKEIIDKCCEDFKLEFGFKEYYKSFIYLTAKSLFVKPECSFNRPGYHSDGFMTNDINYIWSDKCPTIFNNSNFNLTQNDLISMKEMEEQASIFNEKVYPNNQLLKLNQYNIHKVGNVNENGIRTFIKISFSKDQYNLIGNSHNYLLRYNWQMISRKLERNIPQSIIT